MVVPVHHANAAGGAARRGKVSRGNVFGGGEKRAPGLGLAPEALLGDKSLLARAYAGTQQLAGLGSTD